MNTARSNKVANQTAGDDTPDDDVESEDPRDGQLCEDCFFCCDAECHRHAPRPITAIPVTDEDGNTTTTTPEWTWPKVEPDMWCGEFRPATQSPRAR
jgi:hypothetical protein